MIEHFAGRATTAEHMALAEQVEAWLKTVKPQKAAKIGQKFNVSTAYVREVVRILIAHNRAHTISTGTDKLITHGAPAVVTIGPRAFKEYKHSPAMLAQLERCKEVYPADREWITL